MRKTEKKAEREEGQWGKQRKGGKGSKKGGEKERRKRWGGGK